MIRPTWILLAALLLPILGEACTLAWNPVSTFVDGSHALGTVRYLLYFQARRGAVELVLDTDATQVTLPCSQGTYWITAYLAEDQDTESAASNRLSVKGKDAR